MMYKNGNYLQVMYVYVSIVILLFTDLLLRNIRGIDVIIPDFYSISFYISILFCTMKLTIINAFIIGVCEDTSLNHILGTSSLAYLSMIFPVYKARNYLFNSFKNKIIPVIVTLIIFTLIKSIFTGLIRNHEMHVNINIAAIVTTVLVGIFINRIKDKEVC